MTRGYPPLNLDRWQVEDRNYVTPCHVWTGTLDRDGYGKVSTFVDGRKTSTCAHRLIWTRQRGPIPTGLQLDHLCRVRACVRVDHLEPVTPRENTIRAKSAAAGIDTHTHCVNRHERSEANTRINADGSTSCRPCNAAAARRSKARRQAVAA